MWQSQLNHNLNNCKVSSPKKKSFSGSKQSTCHHLHHKWLTLLLWFCFQETSGRCHLRGLPLCHWGVWPRASLWHRGTLWPRQGRVGQCGSNEYPTEWVWGGSVGWLYLRGRGLWWHLISELSWKVSVVGAMKQVSVFSFLKRCKYRKKYVVSGQRKNAILIIQLPTGPVYFNFNLPPLKSKSSTGNTAYNVSNHPSRNSSSGDKGLVSLVTRKGWLKLCSDTRSVVNWRKQLG